MNVSSKPLTVFGLGYVGLPLALSYAMKGCRVYGIDVSGTLVNELRSGFTQHLENYRGKPIGEILKENLESRRFIPGCDPENAFESSDKYIVTVGIPVKGAHLDLEPLGNVFTTLSRGLKKGDTVIIRSTLVPGTTEEFILPILEKSGLQAGEDYHLIYCPERISEGNAFDELERLPVIISGIDEASIDMGKRIIKMISAVDPVPVSGIKLAETAKLIENVQRDVNIALANELSAFCKNMGVDIFELQNAVNTHPRVNLLKPGPGVGGYCIPNAFRYLEPQALKTGSSIGLLRLSREINHHVPQRIAEEIRMLAASLGKKPEETKIAVLGMAMKDNCCDDRQSPAVDIINLLIGSGFPVKAYDPWVAGPYPFKSKTLEECLDRADCLLIAAVQKDIPFNDFPLYRSLMNENAFIYDTRNIVDKSEASRQGFRLYGL